MGLLVSNVSGRGGPQRSPALTSAIFSYKGLHDECKVKGRQNLHNRIFVATRHGAVVLHAD